MDDYLVGVLSNIGVISFIALSAYVLLLTGEISFGQQAFFAIGAYAAGIATAMWGWPLAAGLAWGAAVAVAAAVLVGVPTLRLHGLYFAIATLAFAEMVRLLFELLRYQVEIGGELVGPNGADGFRDIRYVFQNNVGPVEFMTLIYAMLAAVLAGLMLLERSRLGVAFRMIGEDATLAALQGLPVDRLKVVAAGLAGALAGIGGGLYAHLTTYVEPRIFDVMLGVHSLAYGLIGGLGTVLGPLLGVLIDIGLLESIRVFSGYRMIIFGGLVALLLIVRPRGLLDEILVHRIGRAWSGARRRARLTATTPALVIALAVLAAVATPAGAADIRAKADVTCAPAKETLHYECRIKLTDARSGQPLNGVDVRIGADMPSMPGAHSVRPVKAAAGEEPGTYGARIALEMHGDWALRLDLAGPVRDRVIKVMRFDDQRVTDAPGRAPHRKH
jgi:branched-chain amino acid transport system permease protein